MDSDSVNLGSNPSSPATDFIEEITENGTRKSEKNRNGTRTVAAHNPAQWPALYVYFITTGEAVKIGRAGSVPERLKALQTGHHIALTILASFPAGEGDEGFLHRHFAEFHIQGEWFKDVPQIRDAIVFLTRHSGRLAAGATIKEIITQKPNRVKVRKEKTGGNVSEPIAETRLAFDRWLRTSGLSGETLSKAQAVSATLRAAERHSDNPYIMAFLAKDFQVLEDAMGRAVSFR